MGGCRAGSRTGAWHRRAWLSDARGGVAIIFGLALVPIAFAVGAALDYSRAGDARTHLQSASDAAALSAVTPAALAMSTSQAQAAAISLFNSNASNAKFATNVNVTVAITDQPSGRNVRVTFQADVPTTLSRIAGFNSVLVTGNSASASAPPIYVDFHMLLDNTPSMGVGATTADIAKLQGLTTGQPDGACAFACHVVGSTTDNYSIARSNNVQMRIDVVRTATQQLMDTATAAAVVPGQFRASVHTFGASCAALGASLVSPLTSNLAAVKTSAGSVDLMTIPSQNFNNDQCSDYDGTLASMNLFIATPGNGSTASSPQKLLFFVADGVADAFYPSSCTRPTTGGRCQEPISQGACQALKNRGIKIAVLYTTYLPLPGNSWYNTWIAPFSSSIPTQMQSCASPGLYFEVSPSQGISDAMTALFQRYLAQVRILT